MDVPAAEGIAGEQGTLDAAPNPAAPVDAVVFAPCVELLRASPGNCTAACGLTEADALIPDAPDDPDPVVAGPPAGAGVKEVDVFDEDVLNEPASQPSAIERLPMNEPPDPEQGVPGRLAPLTVGFSKEPVLVAEEPVLEFALAAVEGLGPEIVPFGTAPCETTCA